MNTFRAGNIRRCFADTDHIKAMGYCPRVRFEEGAAELVAWVRAERSGSF